MIAPNGSVALTFNGEIYNYVELRRQLEDRGHRFVSTGDTEVLLSAYLEWGPACVQRLVGMWAFGIIDLERDRLLLSRDRFGIKPLFYAPLPGGGIGFASELKALRRLPGLSWQPNPRAVKRYLRSGLVDEGQETFFEDVLRVEPATNLTMSLEHGITSVRKDCYWAPPAEPGPGSPDDATQLRELLDSAVQIHLRSDVPLGTCLSGGIDSSGIVGICDQLRKERELSHYTHHAYGYVPPTGKYSEERFMREVAHRHSVELEIVKPTADEFEDALLDVVRQQDEPFGSLSIAAQYFVFGAARRGGMKVMLDGQGADEVFGGYHYYLSTKGAQLLQGNKKSAYLRFAMKHQRMYGHPPIKWWELARRTPMRHLLRLRRPGPQSPQVPGLLTGDLEAVETEAPTPPRTLHDLLTLQTMSESLPALLRFEDRNSMAHSIEGRVPYLDHRVVDFGFSLPADRKIAGVTTKAILREALSDVLPRSVLDRRDKIGFRADTEATFRFARRHAQALTEPRTSWEKDWLDDQAIPALLHDGCNADATELALWRAINLKLWLRINWDTDNHPLAPAGRLAANAC